MIFLPPYHPFHESDSPFMHFLDIELLLNLDVYPDHSISKKFKLAGTKLFIFELRFLRKTIFTVSKCFHYVLILVSRLNVICSSFDRSLYLIEFIFGEYGLVMSSNNSLIAREDYKTQLVKLAPQLLSPLPDFAQLHYCAMWNGTGFRSNDRFIAKPRHIRTKWKRATAKIFR